MTKIREIYDAIDHVAPFASAMPWDNVGLLIGDEAATVTRCLLTLDATAEVCTEAAEKGVELIIAHHPTIFSPLKTIPSDSIPYRLIQAKISLIAAHTNFDRAEKGLNSQFADFLALGERVVVEGTDGCCLVGSLPEEVESGAALATLLKARMNLPALRFLDGHKPIRRVGMSCGGGGEFAEAARKAGADAFITGEAKHHELIDALNKGLTLLEAGHFETERFFPNCLCELLVPLFPKVEFLVTEKMETLTQTLV